ncbi:phosphate acyltransferase [Candidatus Photodesmus katoptron]|uniref:Phosphate acyltransferase n=1 Tax=Candidatus Photodesmus katoptron Akat1 TaxID=1236703 RepID=S3EHI8_9GAMM|nr:phosphate acyltransferase PlsX [Candidatus Photodesmus katoptron]EPE37648.1 fatty acid/phospholipid synthesis protein PlsX [Candidatus Photodesmus katoptron Akat1]KEY90632.1 phosphate acyltransferase [Candidatus Photodesmus katoptron]
MQNIIVALDAMGGDFGPQVTVPAALRSLLLFPELKVILTGDQTAITSKLSLLVGCGTYPRLSIKHSDKVISDSEKPSLALRHGSESSMAMAVDLVANDFANACISAGNTGALVAISRFKLKLLPGLEQPALISTLPTALGNKTWMLDLGANVSSSPDSIFQFALMGSILAEQHLGRLPRVALLNIGSEKIKGNHLVKHAAKMLYQNKLVNFIGYIEGNQLLYDAADVIVCDGFLGNICLKVCEGTAQLFMDKLKLTLVGSSLRTWIAKKIFSGLFAELQTLNPDQYNGASLLGLNGVVIKSHGGANVLAIVNAITEAVYEVRQKVSTHITDRLKSVLCERHY